MSDPRALKQRWLSRAFDEADIDGSVWDPGLGVHANRSIVEAVYDYYGRLYLRDARLRWAGMAKMIGASFFGGFLDLAALSAPARRLGARPGFYETTFLTMQKKIFEDQAVMHEAYLAEGMSAISELAGTGIIDTTSMQAWELIDHGGEAEIDVGNRTLLYREQFEIIDHFYVLMRGHDSPEGMVFTYAMTLGGAPSVPGARPYAGVFPLKLVVGVASFASNDPQEDPASRAVAVSTPLADGNIAIFTNRWALIESDTLPAYQRLVTNHPARVRQLVAIRIARRVRRYRLVMRLGRLLAGLVTRWRVCCERQPATARKLQLRRPTPAKVPAGSVVEIDLAVAPSWDAPGLSPTGDHQAWANASHHPFRVDVLLPGQRTYTTTAQLAVMLSPSAGGNPTWLTVKSPATDLEAAAQALAGLAVDWGISEAAIEAWRQTAAQAADEDHAYDTRVFQAEPIGFVRLEFQIEHHVRENDFVIDALFSWDSVK